MHLCLSVLVLDFALCAQVWQGQVLGCCRGRCRPLAMTAAVLSLGHVQADARAGDAFVGWQCRCKRCPCAETGAGQVQVQVVLWCGDSGESGAGGGDGPVVVALMWFSSERQVQICWCGR